MPGEIVLPRGFSVGKARLEGAVVDAIKAWATAHLEELVALERHVKDMQHAGAGRPRGGLMLKAQIPSSLNVWLNRRIKPGWLNDPELRNMVFRNFTVGMVNRRSEMWR